LRTIGTTRSWLKLKITKVRFKKLILYFSFIITWLCQIYAVKISYFHHSIFQISKLPSPESYPEVYFLSTAVQLSGKKLLLSFAARSIRIAPFGMQNKCVRNITLH
jgi:hypothetical protein